MDLFLAKDGFSISYTHSVERTQVIEKYRFENDGFVLSDTWFHSHGAGLPSSTDYDFETSSEGFHIYNINQYFEEVIYRSGKKIADHHLLMGEKKYPFTEFTRPGSAVLFRVEKVPYWKLFLGGVH
ncbi:MAG TPA: DUF1850 domain-containing protein [Clostridia bacterium]|nr:DUF1850 domain-containing protein [Clostridia bacterium]